MRASLFIAASTLFLAASCASTSDSVDEGDDGFEASRLGKGQRGVSVSVSYDATAKGNFVKGEQEFNEENYLAAQKYFAYIRSKFPYSKYATQAELRIADCLYERGRHLEAIDGYQNFIRVHSTHVRVAYAMRMTGKAYYDQIPTDWFLMPPSEEKDQSSVRDAATALKAYLDRFPEDEGVEDARKIYEDARRRLMAHERYAADFYRNLDKPRAYVGRLEVIRARFADVGLSPELLLEIADVYAELGEVEKARGVLAQCKDKFPSASQLAAVKAAVNRAKQNRPAKPATGAPDASP